MCTRAELLFTLAVIYVESMGGGALKVQVGMLEPCLCLRLLLSDCRLFWGGGANHGGAARVRGAIAGEIMAGACTDSRGLGRGNA